MANYMDAIYHADDRTSGSMRVYDTDGDLSVVIVGRSGSNARFRMTRAQVATLRSMLNDFLDVEDASAYDEGWQKGFQAGEAHGREMGGMSDDFAFDEGYARGVNDERERLVFAWATAAGA